MTEFIRQLPKAELHVHVEGTLEPEMAFALAERNAVALPFADAAALTAAHQFTNLQSFLDLYYACMQVLRTPQDFTDLADAYFARAHQDGVRHVELFFDPQAHVNRGIPLADLIDGLSAATTHARDSYGLSVLLIACFLRDRPVREAMTTLEALEPHLDHVRGVGLDSAEIGSRTADFAPVFAAAADLGLRRVAHAGEEGAPEQIWQALDELGAERIDHGIRAIEDPALMTRLATDGVPLTICPLSNVRLQCVEDLAQHPLAQLLDAGIVATINSDDPAYFGGYIADNYAAVQRALGLTDADLASVAANSLHASFVQLSDAAEPSFDEGAPPGSGA
jgi:adenosine deaminase